MKRKENSTSKRKIMSKQAVALAGVILLVLMYVITLITAIADNSESAIWFRISLTGTFVIPLIIWFYVWMYGRLTRKHTIGDPDIPVAGADDAVLQQEASCKKSPEPDRPRF